MDKVEDLSVQQLEELLSKKKKQKNKKKFSKLIVSAIVMLNVLFAIAVFYAFIRVGSEPTTLIMSWFAFTTGELWLLAGIKKNKNKEGVKDYE